MSAFKGVQSSQESLSDADTLFKAGKFYAEALILDPRNVDAIVRLASTALFANRLDVAQSWLTQALEFQAPSVVQ